MLFFHKKYLKKLTKSCQILLTKDSRITISSLNSHSYFNGTIFMNFQFWGSCSVPEANVNLDLHTHNVTLVCGSVLA
jgi:hypothetical protein